MEEQKIEKNKTPVTN